VETEEIASAGERWPVRAGVRLSIYEKVEDRAAGDGRSGILDDPMTRAPDPPIPFAYGTRLRIRAKLHPRAITAILELSTMRVTCATNGIACWGRRRRGD